MCSQVHRVTNRIRKPNDLDTKSRPQIPLLWCLSATSIYFYNVSKQQMQLKLSGQQSRHEIWTRKSCDLAATVEDWTPKINKNSRNHVPKIKIRANYATSSFLPFCLKTATKDLTQHPRRGRERKVPGLPLQDSTRPKKCFLNKSCSRKHLVQLLAPAGRHHVFLPDRLQYAQPLIVFGTVKERRSRHVARTDHK